MNILIADDHELFRAGSRMLLEKQPFVTRVAEAASGKMALAELEQERYDLLIVDFDMPDGNGLEVIKRLCASKKSAPAIILLTGMNNGVILNAAIDAGASAVVSKQGQGQELLDAVAAINDQRFYLSAEFEQVIRDAEVLQSLTRREHEVLKALTDGLSTQAVADTLGVSFKTAETHKTRVMQKLDVHSITELLLLAVDLGLRPSRS